MFKVTCYLKKKIRLKIKARSGVGRLLPVGPNWPAPCVYK